MPAAPLLADRRVRRTHLALRNALLDLLAEKEWEEISIKDLCDRADVGRSTFYLHFEGKEQLLAEGFSDLRRFLQEQAAASGRRAGSLTFLRGLVEHVHEQRRVFRALIGKGGSQIVQSRFRKVVAELVAADLAHLGAPSWTRQAAVRFVAGALVETLSWWVDARCAPSSGEMEGNLRRLCEAVAAAASRSREGGHLR